MTERDQSVAFTVTFAAHRTGISQHTIRRYVRRGLVNGPLTKAELAELRRIRRLTELGVNLAGVEIILHMRRQIEELQAEVTRLQALLGTGP
jgi:MerR family transcriptional regulator/heat shock protein HspR